MATERQDLRDRPGPPEGGLEGQSTATGLFSEDDLIPLSALSHFCFCPRRAALIHIERLWEENRFTAEGRLLHERVDAGGSEKRREVKRVFSLPIRSLRLGVSGKADVVEFHLGPYGVWQPFPVEHKRGRRKSEDWDRVQLCAQGLCLEEMLAVSVPEGALFYGKEQRREVVKLDERLRRKTQETAREVHQILRSSRTPPPKYTPRCERCSLMDICRPRDLACSRADPIGRYLATVLGEP